MKALESCARSETVSFQEIGFARRRPGGRFSGDGRLFRGLKASGGGWEDDTSARRVLMFTAAAVRIRVCYYVPEIRYHIMLCVR